ncbi:MAG: WbqC family protein [Candidatus Rokubacteria bacterium]|nr:WbqC family protein [Candidatus Rokubacteria bacterium]
MKVAIHQPHYLPWLGYFAKWAAADVFVLLDTVQYEKNGWQNRNRIKTRDGARWLTIPVRSRLGMPIREVPIDDDQPWTRRHLTTIAQAYARAPYLERHHEALRAFYERTWTRLAPATAASAQWLAEALGIRTPARLASDLGITTADPSGRLVDICRALGATTYLAGGDATSYLDVRPFAAAGLTVLQQRYGHPEYRQEHGPFVPFLSALDVLLMHGDDALPILRRGDDWHELTPA